MLLLAACAPTTEPSPEQLEKAAEKAVASAVVQAHNASTRAPRPATGGVVVTRADLPEAIQARYGHEAALVAGEGTITRYMAPDGAPVFYWSRPDKIENGNTYTAPDTVLVESCASFKALIANSYGNVWCVRD